MNGLPSLRIGFIGGYGHHYLRPALNDPAITVEAIAITSDDDPAAARAQFAAVLDAATWYDDAIDMLDTFKPNIVNVGGIYARKTPILIEVLRRGIAVVADKPVAASWKALDALREAAHDRILLTEFNFRSRAPFLAARQAVEAGLIGDVVLASAQKSYRFGDDRPDFYRRREDYGSTLLWVASHGIDAIHFATGLSFRTVAAAHGNVSKPDYGDMEDHCAALFTLDNGATAVVHADFLRPAAAATHGDDRLRIAGTQGVIEVRDDRCMLTTHDQPQRDITDSAQVIPTHQRLLQAAFQNDTRDYSTQASLEMAAVLLAARDAADTRQIVPVP